MTVKYTLLYTQGAVFDLDYYVKEHMPMIAKLFPGLLSWDVSTFPADAPYSVEAHVEWSTQEAFDSMSTTEEGKKVFADIPNFAKEAPIFMKSTLLAKSS